MTPRRLDCAPRTALNTIVDTLPSQFAPSPGGVPPRGEAESPEWRSRVDHGEQEVSAAGHECTSSSDAHDA